MSCMSGGRTNRNVYTKKDVDIIAAYVEPERIWYIIPVEKVRGETLYLYPHRVNNKGYYEMYKDAWYKVDTRAGRR